MEDLGYLSKYLFDWEAMDLVIGGKSALDSKFFVGPVIDEEQSKRFLLGYGLDYDDPVTKAELFGNFQEALQFIRRYFLKEGNEDGLDLKIPNGILMVMDISDLFIMAVGSKPDLKPEDIFWAEAILKIMHTILHVDKDLRFNYFQAIQTQIFDRFYKYLDRDKEEKLFLKDKEGLVSIPLANFETKSRKERDSVVIKLLHKAENVAEELFDRVGVRIVTENRFDALRVAKFLLENFIVIPHNIKPSRSVNNLVDLAKFKGQYKGIVKLALKDKLSEEEFLREVSKKMDSCLPEPENGDKGENLHTLKDYQSIQFTCRQLVNYKNPFFKDFNELRQEAKSMGDKNPLAAKILNLDMGMVPREVRFFYPYEVQVFDLESYKVNTEGEASHQEYKKSQIQTAMKRVFESLIKYKGLSV